MKIIRKQVTRILNRLLRKIAFLSKVLFGVKIVGGKRIHWDFTTLILKKALNKQIRPGYKVLEIGTGPHAILSIYIAKRVLCDITACDINNEYVENAMKTAVMNDVSLKIVQSDLFENIEGKFDIIFWNSIYIPYKIGKSLDIDNICQYETDWCGGETGFESIGRFLQSSHNYLKSSGKILLGFNNLYLKENIVKQKCEGLGFLIESVSKKILNPSRVIIVSKI